MKITHHGTGLVVALLLASILIGYSEKNNITENSSVTDFTDYLNERIPELMKQYDIPGVNIAIVKEGELIWSNAYGYANLETGSRMTIDTICRAESISKPVTAWGVMHLLEEGLIELDDPVMKHIDSWEMPETLYLAEKVTINKLLSHTAGMPLGTIGVHYPPGSDMPSLRSHLSSEAILYREPGKVFSYSNIGYNLLELMIEDVTERDFAEYMQDSVLSPLGMNKSSYEYNQEWSPAVPNGYDLEGKAIPVYVYPDKASGGLFCTVEDLARFVIAGMIGYSDETIIKNDNLEAMYTPTINSIDYYGLIFDSYGLGYFIEKVDGKELAVAHGGQGSGWMTHLVAIPRTGAGIVILSNSQRSWPFFGYILSDWVRWCGFGSIGMGKLVLGEKILSFLVAGIFSVSLIQAFRVVGGVISGEMFRSDKWKITS